MFRPSTRRAATFAIGFFVLTLLAAPLARAQGFDPERMRERMVAQVGETIDALELEGETADTVRAILMARAEKRMELFSSMRGGNGDRQAMGEAIAKMDEETGEKLAGVLTGEQVAKWKAREEELRLRRRRPRN